MLQMDSQFNTLLRSFHDNYLQYKITGDPNYQTSYASAEEGLNTIVSTMTDEVNAQKKQIADFYKSGVEENLNDLQATNRSLQHGILSEHDLKTTAQMRQDSLTTPIPAPSITTAQYIIMGMLLLAVGGLMIV